MSPSMELAAPRGTNHMDGDKGEAEGASWQLLTVQRVVTARTEPGAQEGRGMEGTECSQGMASPRQWFRVGRLSETQRNPSPSSGVFQILT